MLNTAVEMILLLKIPPYPPPPPRDDCIHRGRPFTRARILNDCENWSGPSTRLDPIGVVRLLDLIPVYNVLLLKGSRTYGL